MDKESKKVVKTFGFASFFNDLGSEMAYPILPLFAREVLKAKMQEVGIIDGLAESTIAISQALSGFISDKIKKRKIFIWLGYLVSGIGRLGYAFSFYWQTLVGFRILNNFGKVREAPRDAFVSDVSLNNNRARNFGILRMMDNLGAFLGILICILLFKYLGYRKIFLLAAIPSLISAILVLIFIKESPHLYSKDNDNFHLNHLSKNYKKFLLVGVLFALASFSYSFLLIFVKEAGFKEIYVPFLYLLFILITSLSSIPFGKLADKIGRKRVLAISFVFWGFVCLSFLLIKNPIFFIIPFIFYGLSKGAQEPAERAFVSEISPKDYKTSGLGIYKMTTGLCALPSYFIAGFLWDKVNRFLPFYLGLILTIISLILLLFIKEKTS